MSRFNEIQGSNKNNDENQALNLTTETGKYGYERGEACRGKCSYLFMRGAGPSTPLNESCRHSAARKRRRGSVFDSARLNQLNSSWTFTRARESAPPYGKWASRLARWFVARVIRVVKTIFQQSFSDHVSAPACCKYTCFRRTNTCIGSGLSSTSRYLAAV